MTHEQQNITIATACGWTDCKLVGSDETQWTAVGDQPGSRHHIEIPNYYGDLNACAEMEKTLTPDEAWDYCDYLDRNVSATAPQRCEAFLRTKGLWRD